jgi:ABC-type nitrate/sulfonate/bicarbonate transport system permease component
VGETLDRKQLLWLSVTGLAIFFGLWTFAAWVELAPRKFLPLPWDVVERGIALLTQPFSGQTLQGHLAASLQRYLLGFALAAAIGVPLGLLMGWYRWLDHMVTPLFDSLRFIAPIAWVPFAALWFGTGIGGPMLIIFAGAFPPCLINAYRRRSTAPRARASSTRCCCRPRCPRSSPACASAPAPAGRA